MTNIIEIDINKVYKNDNNRKYIELLKSQIFWLQRNKTRLFNNSQKLYKKYMDGTLNSTIVDRCCNFKLLEEKCLKYNKTNKKTKF